MTNHLLLLRYRQQKSMHRTWSLFGDPKKPKKVYVTNYNIILLPKTAIGSLYNTKARVILSRCVNEYKTKKKPIIQRSLFFCFLDCIVVAVVVLFKSQMRDTDEWKVVVTFDELRGLPRCPRDVYWRDRYILTKTQHFDIIPRLSYMIYISV